MVQLVRQGNASPRFQDFVNRTFGQTWQRISANDMSGVDRWIRGHFRYRGELREVLRTVDFMLNDLQTTGYVEGDCDDISIFYAAVLRSMGYQVRLVAIRYDDPEFFQHVFVEYYDNGVYRRVDPTTEAGVIHEELERIMETI